jgi:filamin
VKIYSIHIDIDIVENADGTFSLLFTPQIEGAYTISIKFGGQTVPGGEYDIQVGSLFCVCVVFYLVKDRHK